VDEKEEEEEDEEEEEKVGGLKRVKSSPVSEFVVAVRLCVCVLRERGR